MALKVPDNAPTKPKASWMKTGAESAEVAKKHEAEAQKRREEQGKAFRFFMEKGEEARITFVDGDLSPEGYLLPPRFYEHSIMLNGKWGNNFVCPQKTNPDAGENCPLCEADDYPSLVSLFTVIDHRTYTSEKTKKTYTNTRKLLVAKSQSFEQLNSLAQKMKGLIGTTWDVTRVGDKSPGIGNQFFPVGKELDIEKLKKMYTREVVDGKTNAKSIITLFEPLDYESEIIYRSGDELRAMGLGKPTSVPASGFGQSKAAVATNYGEQL